MKDQLRIALIGASLALAIGGSAMAGGATQRPDGTTVWQAGVDGVEIEWNEDGTVKRIYSRFSTPVEFPDRRGIAKAQVIAEEKAKAGIIRFMNQSVTSARVVAEVQSDLNKATQERKTGSGATVVKTDQRILLETLTEVTGSFAAGTLRGVVVLEKGYDDKKQEAWTVVGISQKTIEASRAVRDMTTNSRGAESQGAIDSVGKQGSEVRRTKQKEW